MTTKGNEAAPERRIPADLVAWIAVGAVVALCFALREQPGYRWLVKYPSEWQLPLADVINALMLWFMELPGVRFLFRGTSAVLSYPMNWIQELLHWLPWPATIAAFTVLAFVARGAGLALFTALALLYMVVIGYWSESMNTLALVFMSIPLAVAVGLGIGIVAFQSRRVNLVVQPTLDLMQTVPTFAYLIPILLLFGFGPVVGLIASAIYACPPMVRNVVLGLSRVPREVVESAIMSGATRRQLLWWVQVPSALPTVMIGVNQTVMAALSMVIIAALIGSSEDIGWEVVSTMRKAAFGPSLLAGIVIALIAMIFDRISRGFADPQRLPHAAGASSRERRRALGIAAVSMAGFAVLAHFVAPLREFPDAWSPYHWLAAELSQGITHITSRYHEGLDYIKNTVLFYFLLPLRVGFETAVRPHIFGFSLTPGVIAAYAALSALAAGGALRRWGWRAAVLVTLLSLWLYFGMEKVPWPAFVLIVTVVAAQVGGMRLAALALFGLLYLAGTGIWSFAMKSVYLCGAAVLTSFVAGGLVGAWAAHSDRLSGFIRPINDTLQTMPLFVLLIPVLMFFQIGEFTAYLAIIMYAVVPAIRYTEHGLRHVPAEIVEAAASMGCTRRQILWQVKLPLAIPEIMLGLNQTIMFGLAMLVIAALVGTKGLGQQIYVALNAGDTGRGLVAGFGIALIAIITDRIIQAWSARKKAVLGLT